MAFLIRQITRTADGREIVRARRIEADTVTVGRAADNDIALPDLVVTLHHARITREDDRRIAVTATGTLGFEVDGRSRTRCVIDSAKGAEIAIADNRITVTRDGEGLVVLTVASAARSEAAEYEEAAAFSLKGKLPGKRASAWLLAIAVLIGFLALPVWSYVQKQRADHRDIYAATADRSWSSGPLSAAHHALENQCEACHVKAFVSVRDATCAGCHKDAHEHASPARLTRARDAPDLVGRTLQRIATAFGKPGPGACVDCHTEHEGAGPLPPTPQAFCADCHGALTSRLADTKLGNASDFGTAHPQFRPLVSTAPGRPATTRVSLDARPADDGGLKFPHKLHLDPLGGVTRMAQTLKARFGYGDGLTCTDCHTPTADGARYVPVRMEKSCQGCHSLGFDRVGGTVRNLRHGDIPQVVADLRSLYRWSGSARPAPGARRRPGDYAASRPGGGAPMGGNAAVTAAFSRGGACYDCHTIAPPGVGGSSQWSVTPVHQPLRYLQHGWFDHAAHKTETCSTCHAATQSSQASDLLLPGIATCRTCHGGENAAKAKVPSSCAMCHSYHVTPGAPWKSSLGSTTPRARAKGG